jgi:hypothetical protein
MPVKLKMHTPDQMFDTKFKLPKSGPKVVDRWKHNLPE